MKAFKSNFKLLNKGKRLYRMKRFLPQEDPGIWLSCIRALAASEIDVTVNDTIFFLIHVPSHIKSSLLMFDKKLVCI